ncbi:MAG TPA: HAD family hydrolase [Devosiaceae bacterium]|nr:HAD family hydrolase [Devosiaceae bacterium]
MTNKNIVLVLDLDGVVVFEATPPAWVRAELLLLHRELTSVIAELGVDVAILTHRSRREADRILHSAGIVEGERLRLFSAEDLFRAGRQRGGWRGLWAGGLKKSAVVPEIELLFGVARSDIVFVDDRLDNVDDLLQAGIGLAMLAPSALAADGSLTSFSISEVTDVIGRWRDGQMEARMVALTAVSSGVEAWQSTGVHIRDESLHLFNGIRRIARHARGFAKRIAH